MKKHYFLLLFTLSLFYPYNLEARTLTVFGINAGSYPNIKAKFFANDAAGNQITNLGTQDFEIIENGVNRPVTFVSCPEPRPPVSLSSVLMIDVSGSMEGSGLGYAKSAARAWVNAISLDKSECAIASFNGANFMNQDFTHDRQKLLDALDKLKADDGTDFNAGFISSQSGALLVAKRGINKRVVVFLTDGQAGGDEEDIVSQAGLIDATIYCVVLGMPAPDILKHVAERTGGMWFDNITSGEKAAEIYTMILRLAQDLNPCQIEWTSEGCTQDKSAGIRLLPYSISTQANYRVPEGVLSGISSSEFSLSYGLVQPGTKSRKTVTITARNKPVTVQSIQPDNPRFSVIDFGGPPPPFTLQPGGGRDIIIEYASPDSGLYYTKITVSSDACLSDMIYATAGIYNPATSKPTLNLTHPNGREVFPAGIDTVIKWEGILPDEKVRLDYSTDGGVTWIFITDTASGLKYRWKVPNTPGNRCLMRVRLADSPVSAPGYIELKHHSEGFVTSLTWSPGGKLIATAADSSIYIWESYKGILIKKIATGDRPAWWWNVIIKWCPDGNTIAGLCPDSSIKIWNASSGQLLYTFKSFFNTNCNGVNHMDWSPDGRFIAVIDNYGRIAVVDPTTGNIALRLNDKDFHSAAVHWSPDGKKILSESFMGKYGYNKIWDVNTGNKILSLDNDSVQTCMGGMDWSPDGRFIATNYFSGIISPGGRDYQVRIYDTQNGSIVKKYYLDWLTSILKWNPNGRLIAYDSTYYSTNGIQVRDIIADTAMFLAFHQLGDRHVTNTRDMGWSSDGCRLAACGYTDSMACIWSFCGSEPQEDVSDTLWSIVAPLADAADIDMGRVLVGRSRDSVVRAFLTNTGSYPVRIDTIYFSGQDASMFSLVSGMPPYEIPAGGSHQAEFRFKPASTGIKTSGIVIIMQSGDSLVRNIRGEGVENYLWVCPDILDFGQVWTGLHKDSVKVLLKNTGPDDVEITSTDISGPDLFQFSIIAGGGSFILKPGDDRQLTLRFTPTQPGRTSSGVAFSYNGTGSPAIAAMFGEGIEMKTLVMLPDTIAMAGEKNFILPLTARINNEFIDSTLSIDSLSFTAEIRFNADAFLPDDDITSRVDAVTGGRAERVINISGGNISLKKEFTTLYDIKGTVLMPLKAMNSLDITQFQWDRPSVATGTDSGSLEVKACVFNLTHIRQFQPLMLSIQPNPAKDLINLQLSGITADNLRLSIYSAHGLRIEEMTISSESAGSGISISADRYEQGVYNAVVQSGAGCASAKFVVVK